MRGLLLKDFALLKNQSQTLLVVAALAVFMMTVGNDTTLVIAYAVMLFAMFGMNTLSYDHFDNGYAFLFTLPITRKLYVMEKYVFCLLCVFVGSAVAFLLVILEGLIHKESALASSDMTFFAGYILGAIIFQAVILPLRMKFGPEKARIVMISLFVAIIALGTAAKELVESEKVIQLSEQLSSLTPVYILGILAVVTFGILCVSYLSSCKIMEKKEF